MGVLLYVEHPLVLGPNYDGDPVCLSCLKPVYSNYVCGDCEYPMCSTECAQDPCHAEECRILRQNSPGNNYHPVLPLRLLLKQSLNKHISNLTKGLMDHQKQQRTTDYWEFSERLIVDLLHDIDGEFQWSKKDIRKAVGILEVNAYEIESFGRSGFCGLFPLSSLLNHG